MKNTDLAGFASKNADMAGFGSAATKSRGFSRVERAPTWNERSVDPLGFSCISQKRWYDSEREAHAYCL